MSSVGQWPHLLSQALFDESTDDLYEHAPCGYLSLLPDGVVGRVNRTFVEWTGFAKEELVGKRRFLDLLTVGGRIYYETHFQPLLRMQGQVREIAFELARRNGQRLPALVNARQHDYPGVGAITRITVFDATDRRKYERELLAARKRAEDEARAKAELVATISHDVRAPLSAIATAVALLDKSSPTSQQAKYIRVMQSSTSHALRIVNDLLELGRLEAGGTAIKDEPFSLRELVRDIAAAARAGALEKTNLDVTTHVDENAADALIGDRALLSQVLTNLMTNAVKFTERGFVRLIVHAREVTTEDVALEVSVSDTGIGIAPERMPRIFDEYTQASEEIASKYGGSGLGLAISRKILRLYGSELNVMSTVGEGTTFAFVITLKRASARPIR